MCSIQGSSTINRANETRILVYLSLTQLQSLYTSPSQPTRPGVQSLHDFNNKRFFGLSLSREKSILGKLLI
ncbi:hypothetical protein M7I_3804 [Glarea lozoyensis 74030]|uniref:Uncharacterized protein n=1 Tax=Glarea lozoyensis (strain ATCC 74030 / MF5533) TaxID=1104152 RepID=H0EMG7_GLAL7|nr:hypothetical protein M7I_3804 [Glarea lozoyensis 74030]